ncbi:unnamed protein product [Prorocentrum cordatum]|uniref:EF-hand domain-containing protein n=1 Tax=Prorocentrum cordatum TaxID=2364126 RepID=A0ABN9SNP3_9DINO|nr:unnamed protein product [Polarella glacialis]
MLPDNQTPMCCGCSSGRCREQGRRAARAPLPTRGCASEAAALRLDDLYVGRGCGRLSANRSFWANPVKISQEMPREAAIDKFAEYLCNSDEMMKRLPELGGKRLVCYCATWCRCHADRRGGAAVSSAAGSPASGADRDRMNDQFKFAEVFAGSAKLSNEMMQHGCAAVPILKLDLTTRAGREALHRIYGDPDVEAAWFAPPGETFCRARETLILMRLRKESRPAPRPLRDDRNPLGIPSLSTADAANVAKENQLADVAAESAATLRGGGELRAIESPARSWIWKRPSLERLAVLPGVREAIFQRCMYGGTRDKSTKIFASSRWLADAMCATCDKSHARSSWGSCFRSRWSAASVAECECPDIVRSVVANAFDEDLCYLASKYDEALLAKRGAMDDGRNVGPSAGATPRSLPAHPPWVPVGRQRSKLGHNVAPEFKKVIPAGSLRTMFDCESPLPTPWSSTMAPSCLLGPLLFVQRSLWRGCGGLNFGVPWAPREILGLALLAKRPFDAPPAVDDDVAAAVFDLLTTPLGDIKTKLDATKAQWQDQSAFLRDAERRLHEQMHPRVQGVLGGKNVLVFQHMFQSVGHADAGVASDAATGFRLVGDFGCCGAFPPKPSDKVEEGRPKRWLLGQAPAVRASLEAAAANQHRAADRRIDAEVLEKTRVEVQRGLASGPFLPGQLDEVLGPRWAPSRRFGVVQGEKVQPIDDLAASFVNGAATIRDEISWEGVDGVASVAKLWARLVAGPEDVTWTLQSGRVLRGRHLWKDDVSVGKCFDLVEPCKQLAVTPVDSDCAVFACADPQRPGEVLYFVASALPFGARASVLGFSRAAAALEICAIRLDSVPITNDLDDFPFVVPKVLSEWMGGGRSRLALAVSDGELPPDTLPSAAGAARLVGELQFASPQIFGRCGAAGLRHIRGRADGKAQGRGVGGVLDGVLRCWLEYLAAAKPRGVRRLGASPPLVLFTDGARELVGGAVRGGIGAVLVDPVSKLVDAFGRDIPLVLMEQLARETGREQLIGQLEILLMLAARIKWASVFEKHPGRSVLGFVDNDSARFGLIKGYSPSPTSVWLLGEHWQVRDQASRGEEVQEARKPSLMPHADQPLAASTGQRTAIIVENALAHGREDIEERQHEMRKVLKRIIPEIEEVFDKLDSDRSGVLTFEEIEAASNTGELALPEDIREIVEPHRLLEIFEFLDMDQSGDIEIDEFVDGVCSLAVSAVPIETTQILQLIRRTHHSVMAMELIQRLSAGEQDAGLDGLPPLGRPDPTPVVDMSAGLGGGKAPAPGKLLSCGGAVRVVKGDRARRAVITFVDDDANTVDVIYPRPGGGEDEEEGVAAKFVHQLLPFETDVAARAAEPAAFAESLFRAAAAAKEQGNQLFKLKDFEAAQERYTAVADAFCTRPLSSGQQVLLVAKSEGKSELKCLTLMSYDAEGECELSNGDTVEAASVMPVFQELLPLQTSVFMNRARCRQNLGLHQGAAHDLTVVLGLWASADKRMLESDPEMKEASAKGLYTAEYLRGRSRLALGFAKAAADDVKAALARAPPPATVKQLRELKVEVQANGGNVSVHIDETPEQGKHCR